MLSHIPSSDFKDTLRLEIQQVILRYKRAYVTRQSPPIPTGQDFPTYVTSPHGSYSSANSPMGM